MSNSKSDIEVLTQDWVQKFHFENKVDLNLQIPAENESTKIEVGDIPIDLLPKLEFSSSSNNNNSNDSYLQSILSSPSPATNTSSTACTGSQTCACYKCQRQRRRAGIGKAGGVAAAAAGNHTNNKSSTTNRVKTEDKPAISTNVYTPLPAAAASSSPVTSLSDSPTKMSPTTTTIITSPSTPAPSPQPQPQQKVDTKRSNTIRKTPTLRSYEKHMPKPTYSQQDSIYRIEQEQEAEAAKNEQEKKSRTNSTLVTQQQQDNYKMAWKEDGTGDDLLSSLVTFQTIFEEKGNGNEGLSDLLEQRTQELKYQKLREQQDALRPKNAEEELPPRLKECLTLSYRNGPRHNPLTLYHTMKMHGEKERMQAYNLAFKHCINSNSGLRSWIKKSRVAPTRESSKLIQPVRRPTVKRSLLHPLSSRKNKVAGDELLIWSASSDNLNLNSNGSKKSIDMISSPIPLVHTPSGGGLQNNNSNSQLTDVLSAAQALLPNQTINPQQQEKSNGRVPYEHIDTPSRPRHTPPPSSQSTADFKDNSSISSSESASGTSSSYNSSKLMKSRPGRLFSSLGRKTSMRSYSSSSNKASSIRSLEKIDSGNESQSHEKVLDDLCRILPHIDRSQLSPYVYEANNDYMTALQLCKAAVISGKLS